MNAIIAWERIEVIGISFVDGQVEPATPPEFIQRYNELASELYKLHGEMAEWLQQLPDKSQTVTHKKKVVTNGALK